MIVKNISTRERVLRLVSGIVFLALAFLPQWHGWWSVPLLVLSALGFFQAAVCT
jgi:hypothetical protein